MALIGGPVIFFGLLELILLLCGSGYPTAFLLRSSNHGQATFVQNSQFGWRFFGARMARLPNPISIPRNKPSGTVRIFVLGESAAQGDPQPRFGLPRLLEAMLDLRHPGVKFEVVNAAMTAINSHAILPIARDCSRADGDIWVLYMGNNEVVGPFGAGSVFGPRAPPLPLVRTSLAVKATRTGQWLDSLLDFSGGKAGNDKGEWEGMRMFLKQTVRATDPAMDRVYRNFQGNLADIIRAGRASGAGVVVSTVAVNLKDCAPFASLHRADLTDSPLADWKGYFESGIQAQQATNWAKAADLLRAAAKIDDTFAELRFRMGQCALALGQAEEARSQFTAARDLDALRFRCDNRLNDLIREAVARASGSGILLADAERALAAVSPDRLPGQESFYEHVHLTFEGNYALARILAEQVEKLLPRTVPPTDRPWPEIADCARRLGRTDRALQLALSDMLGRVNDAPFTAQANHAEQLHRLVALARGLQPEDAPTVVREAHSVCEAAIAQAPDDPWLYEQLAEIKSAEADSPGAVTAARRSLDLLPSNQDCWLLLGLALAQGEKFTEAADTFRQIIEQDSQSVWGLNNLALCYEKLGRRDDAIREYRRAVALKPQFGTAWLGLSQLYDTLGRKDEGAECFRQALANRVNTAEFMADLARVSLNRRCLEAAVTNFAEAVELKPSDPGLLLEAGRALALAGRHGEAAQRYAQAIQCAPGLAQPHLQLGIELGRLGRPADAEPEFREAVRLSPDSAEAARNLGIALFEQNKRDEALRLFEQVLQRNPQDDLALRYAQQLRPQ